MIVVTGGTGQLGTALRKLLPDAEFPGRDRVNLAAPSHLEDSLAILRPTALINCAAYTAVDRAELEPHLAMTVNAESVGVMARFSARHGVRFITFSTDYVFDGESSDPYVESSPTNPINAYGSSKLAGERAALDVYPDTLIVRTSWILSGTHANFVTAILTRAMKGRVDVVDDQRGCPTFVDDLAPAVLRAMDTDAAGILHLTNQGVATWFDLARRAAAHVGLPADAVRPIPSNDYPTPARRPRNSVLSTERAPTLSLTPLPPWSQSLPATVDELVAGGLIRV